MVVSERKVLFFETLVKLLESHSKLLIVNADNVGSFQLQKIRQSLRGKATVLMGKNTMVRKVFRINAKKFPRVQKLLPLIKGNVGFVFVKGDVNEVREIIAANRVGAPAKAGAIAPVAVEIPAGNTGLEPTKTSFFQALNIPTKITRGCVDILNSMFILTVGSKVGSSEATLLQMLNINPFSYGLKIEMVYDNGSIYEPSVLDMTDDDYADFFKTAVANMAAISLAAHYPTPMAVPYVISEGFKNLLSVAVATDYTFERAEGIKAMLENPEAFVQQVVAPVAEEKVVEEKKEEEPESESDDDMGFGLFD